MKTVESAPLTGDGVRANFIDSQDFGLALAADTDASSIAPHALGVVVLITGLLRLDQLHQISPVGRGQGWIFEC